MIFDLVLFPVFSFVILLIGLGFTSLFCRQFSQQKTHELLVYGLFAIGSTTLVIHFFSGAESIVTLLVLLGLLSLGIKKIKSIKFDLKLVFISILLGAVPSVLPMAYDGGLYHIPHQIWIREHPFTIGLANFHGRFGFNSIFEYISAALWLGDNLKLLGYLQILIVLILISFIMNLSQSSRQSSLLSLFLILNILFVPSAMSVTSIDLFSAVLFTMTVAISFGEMKTDANIKDLVFLFYLSVFSMMTKASTAPAVLLGFFTVFRSFYGRWKEAKSLWMPITISFFYLISNILISGCFLYPLSVSCTNLSWSVGSKSATEEKNVITAWARQPGGDGWLDTIHHWNWLGPWWYRNQHYVVRICVVGLLLCLLFTYLTRGGKKEKDFREKLSLIFVISTVIYWFVMAPDIRFGLGIIWVGVPIVLAMRSINSNRDYYKYVSVFCILFSLKLSFGLSIKNRFSKMDESIPKVEILRDKRFGYRPAQGDQCFASPLCSPYERYFSVSHFNNHLIMRRENALTGLESLTMPVKEKNSQD